MNSERLKQIEKIYHEALDCAPIEREDFLNDSCGVDVELRRKVENLLSFDGIFNKFIDTPPTSLFNEVFSDLDKEYSLINKKVGHYNVRKLIGKGGMGEVYLAEDIQLNRKVALKFLSMSVSGNKNRLRRFEHEALAASALNHPNILTIYEFGVENKTNFLVTEFVEGKTLRELINHSALNLKDILNIAEQTAFALSAAHKSGIIHRDIKPENIMIRDDGIVKVLDFGLAKLINPELSEQTVISESETILKSKQITLANTNSSGVMGTIAYMSPEQLRGLANIDSRTDIWSLGVVLYEMLAGKTPFTGETSKDVIAAILKGKFLPIRNYLTNIPHELERIVEKSLRLDRKDRYQNINELLLDLRNLKDEWNFQSKLDRSQSPHTTDENILKNTNQLRVQQTRNENEETFSVNNLSTNSNAEYFKESVRRNKRRSVAALFTLSLLLISSFVYFKFYSNYFQTAPFKIPNEPISQIRIQTIGNVLETAISPDGKLLLYTTTDGKTFSLRIQQLADNKTFTVISDSDVLIYEPTFSPDGQSIFFLANHDPNSSVYSLYKVANQGGTPEKIVEDIDAMVTFSPDGSEIAFKRNYPQKNESNIFIAKIDGSAERVLAARSTDEGSFCNNPVWSPDGKTIATIFGQKNGNLKPRLLVAISVADGSITKIGTSQWRWTLHLQWLPDGKELLVNATDKPEDFTQFWRVSYPEGNVVKVTNDFNKYEGASINADGTLLATSLTRENAEIFVAPFNNISEVKKVRSIAGTAYYGLDWTPDGKIVFSTNAGRNRDLWMMEADGSNQHQLTNDNFVNELPIVTRDGRYIVYVSEKAGKSNIWRMNTDGSNRVQITNGDNDYIPDVTPDSRWILYQNPAIQKISIDGGESTQLTSRNTGMFQISPDGKFMSVKYVIDQIPVKHRLAILPINGGEPVKIFDRQLESWKWVGDSIIYTDPLVDNVNLFSRSIKTDKITQLTNFASDKILNFAVSKDGKQIAMIRGSVTNEAVIIKNFR